MRKYVRNEFEKDVEKFRENPDEPDDLHGDDEEEGGKDSDARYFFLLIDSSHDQCSTLPFDSFINAPNPSSLHDWLANMHISVTTKMRSLPRKS